jgi:arylsulfatase
MLGGLLALLASSPTVAAESQPLNRDTRRPNIILIVTDDQGYGDLGVHGHPLLKTPHLDRFHSESVRLTDFRVSPTCSPTRAALMTGRHEFMSGVTHTVLERERLSLKATTLPQLLKAAGYSTAIVGKWHLGDEAAYQPGARGFDEVFIHGGGGIGQKYSGSCADAPGNTYNDPAILHNGRFVRTRGYCTDVFFDHAIGWIQDRRDKGTPFFLYLATNAPHAPLVCPPQWTQPYEGKATGAGVTYLGMVANIDHNVGRLVARLNEMGIERDTLVVFMNDNGGTRPGVQIWDGGMAGTKGTASNGGTRAMSLWRWPGTLAAGDRSQLTAHVDVLPTFAQLAGADVPDAVKAELEGRSLVPVLEDGKGPWDEDRVLYTHVGRWGGMKQGTEPRKFMDGGVSVRWRQYLILYRSAGWQLFDLRQDPGQKKDIAAGHADIVQRLSDSYDRWWERVTPNLVNEDAWRTAPPVPPFHVLYRQQMGEPQP